jgi:transcriptional regulator with XRE-family HTH domain
MKGKTDPEITTDVKQILKDIGLKVRMHRKSIAKNYQDFSHDHNFNKITISRIENGKNYTMSTLIQVLHAMNITLEDFFVGID